jgi:hypothetical protein
MKTKPNNVRWLTHVLPVDTSKKEEEKKAGRCRRVDVKRFCDVVAG